MPPSPSHTRVVTVALGDRSYDVHVGGGVRSRLGSVMPVGARRAAVITQAGVGWAVDEHNRSLVSDEMEAAVEQARQDIIAGTIQVTDYMAQ